MGTNYYFHEKEPCTKCRRPYPERHIGKSSAGWVFGLHVYPDEGINDLLDWEARWKAGGTILDEYDRTVTPEEMSLIIRARHWDRKEPLSPEWLRENDATPGPFGLARSRPDSHCLGPGEGTWDLLTGEFS